MYVFVGGSSCDDLDSIYFDEAFQVSKYLASNGYDVVAGCDCGMIGQILNVFDSYHKNVKLVEALPYQKDFYRYSVSFCDTIGERKNSLLSMASLVVFFPGGLGTLDEIFTVIESKRALEYDIPILIVNINHYYDKLIEMLDVMYSQGFASVKNRQLYCIADSVDMAINYIDELRDIDENM